MFALFLKDTSSILPHWIAILALLVLEVTLSIFDTSLTLDGLSARIGSGAAAAFVLFVITFAIGHTLAAPEVAEGQIEFLDSLPTSRTGIYLSKFVAGLLPCLSWIVLALLADLVLLGISPGPPDSDALWPMVFQYAVFLSPVIAGFGLGLLLSWLRVLAWGVLVLVLVIGGIVSIMAPPIQDYVPLVGSWGEVVLNLRTPTHPLGPLAVWTTLGIGGILLSYLLFLGPARGCFSADHGRPARSDCSRAGA